MGCQVRDKGSSQSCPETDLEQLGQWRVTCFKARIQDNAVLQKAGDNIAKGALPERGTVPATKKMEARKQGTGSRRACVRSMFRGLHLKHGGPTPNTMGF